MASRAEAAPWIAPGDGQLRSSLEMLADHGLIQISLDQWPLPWADVAAALQKLPKDQPLSPAERRAVAYIQFEMKYQAQPGLHATVGTSLANRPSLFRDFSSRFREKQQGYAELQWMNDRFAAGLTAGYAHDAQDGHDWRLDGSYLAAVGGNWIWTAGALNRWWGPGWNTSLILSNNARPIPALSVQRRLAQPFSTPWLSWLGPWRFTAFAGELEGHRTIAHAKLLGARLSFQPVPGLEFGLFRTAQWGGNGRPQSLKSLAKLMLGQTNVGSNGVTAGNEAGNQLGGWDARYGFGGRSWTSAVYLQVVGEDEAGYLPSKNLYLAGWEFSPEWFSTGLRLDLEAANTTAGSFRPMGARPDYNVAYNHSVYKSGYRYYGRSIGATWDNDARVVSLGSRWFLPNDDVMQIKLSHLELNVDGARTAAYPSGEFYGPSTLWAEQFQYQTVWRDLRIRAGLTLLSKAVHNDWVSSGRKQISLEVERRF